MKKLVRFLPFFVVALAIGAPQFAHAVSSLSSGFSIVPTECNCGSGAGWGCVLLVIGNLLDLAIGIGVLASVAALAYAGFLWVTNPLNSENRTQGRNMLLNAVVGLIIALAAWLIVNTLLTVLTNKGLADTTSQLGSASGKCLPIASDITGGAGVTAGYQGTATECPGSLICTSAGQCAQDPELDVTANAAAGQACKPAGGGIGNCAAGLTCDVSGFCSDPAATPPTVPSSCTVPSGSTATGNEAAVRQQFQGAGVLINHEACAVGSSGSGCTNVGGMQQATIQLIIALNTVCGGSCGITVTGGSEPGHASGTYSHGNGYKVDLRLGTALDGIITATPSVGYRTGDSYGPAYTDKCGANNQYVKEVDHWDITIHGSCAAPF